MSDPVIAALQSRIAELTGRPFEQQSSISQLSHTQPQPTMDSDHSFLHHSFTTPSTFHNQSAHSTPFSTTSATTHSALNHTTVQRPMMGSMLNHTIPRNVIYPHSAQTQSSKPGTVSSLLARSTTPSTPHALAAITGAVRKSSSMKKKKNGGVQQIVERPSTLPSNRITAWEESKESPESSIEAMQLTESQSIIHKLTHDLVANSAALHTDRNIPIPIPSSNPSDPSILRSFVSPPFLSKLQQILDTHWLSDMKSLEKTEELLLNKRYYKSWKDITLLTNEPNFERMMSLTDGEAKRALNEWVSFLSEGLFLQFQPAMVAPPSANSGVFGPPVLQTSSSLFHFGTRQLYAFLVDKKLHVRIGGGTVELIEYIRNYASIEGRKCLSLCNRDELICLALLLQERLFASVIKRSNMITEFKQKESFLKEDTFSLRNLSNNWERFQRKMVEQLITGKKKIRRAHLTFEWTHAQRSKQFETYEQYSLALENEIGIEEAKIDRIDAFEKRQDALEKEGKGDDESSTRGPVESLNHSIGHSSLPLNLASFIDQLVSTISVISSQSIKSSQDLHAERLAHDATRKLCDQGLNQLREASQSLSSNESQCYNLQSSLSQAQSRINELERIQQTDAMNFQARSDGWSTKLAALLEELKRKDAKTKLEMDSTKSELQDQISILSTSLTQATISLRRKDEQVDDVSRQLVTAQSEINSLQHRLTQSQREMEKGVQSFGEMERINRIREETEGANRELREEIEQLRETVGSIEATRKEEKEKFKRDLAELMQSKSAALSAATASFNSSATTGPLSTSKLASMDSTFELTVDDIFTELPLNDANSHYSSSSSFITPAPSSIPPLPPNISSYIPLSLFSLLYTKFTRVTDAWIQARQNLSLTLTSLTETESKLSQLESTFFEQQETLASVTNQSKSLQQSLNESQTNLLHLQNTHALSIDSFRTTSESKLQEMNNIYQQMLSIKDETLLEAQKDLEDQKEKYGELQREYRGIDSSNDDGGGVVGGADDGNASQPMKPVPVPLTKQQRSSALNFFKPLLLKCHQKFLRLQEDYLKLKQQFQSIIISNASFNVDSTLHNELQSLVDKQVWTLGEYIRKYKYELSLRRKYFDQVQELRGNIRVFVRIRPSLPSVGSIVTTPSPDPSPDSESNILPPPVGSPHAQCLFSNPQIDPSLLNLSYIPATNNNNNNNLRHKTSTNLQFEFDRVFIPQDSQEDVFKHVQALGSGKTYTMSGPADDSGVIPRVLQELFHLRAERSHAFSYRVTLSMMEIHCENVRDLLSPVAAGTQCGSQSNSAAVFGSTQSPSKEYKIHESSLNGITFTPALTEIPCDNEQEVLDAIAKGQSIRATSSTDMNISSSRSHSIVILKIHARDLHSEKSFHAKMQLIDLAGSERIKRSHSTGDRLKEAVSINKSLSNLGNVLQALQNGDNHVPWRSSRLTHILKDSLGGSCKCVMIVTVTPDAIDVPETYCSLQFGLRARKVELLSTGNSNNTTGHRRRSSSMSSSQGSKLFAGLVSPPLDMESPLEDESPHSARPSLNRPSSLSPSPSLGSPSNASTLAQKLKQSQGMILELQAKLQGALGREDDLLAQIASKKNTLPSPKPNGGSFAFTPPGSATGSKPGWGRSKSMVTTASSSSATNNFGDDSAIDTANPSSSIDLRIPIDEEHSSSNFDTTALHVPQADLSHLTSVISNLEHKLASKSHLEDEMRSLKKSLAEKEANWAAREVKWKEMEERRRVAEKNMERKIAAATAAASHGQSDPASFPSEKIDPYEPESVVVTRLNGDIQQLKSSLRLQSKQTEYLNNFLSSQGLPSLETIYRERNFPPSAQHHHSKAICEKLHAVVGATMNHQQHYQDESMASSTVSSPAIHHHHAHAHITPPKQQYLHSKRHSAERSRSEERREKEDSQDMKQNALSAPGSPRQRSSSTPPPISPSSIQPTLPTSHLVEPARPLPTYVHPLTGIVAHYVPHKTALTFKSLIPPPEPKPRNPRVPTRSKQFASTSEEEHKESPLKMKKTATPSKIPRSSKVSKPLNLAATAPASSLQHMMVPSAASSNALSPTQVSIQQGLELSAQILASNSTQSTSNHNQIVSTNSSQQIDESSIPKLRSKKDREKDALVASSSSLSSATSMATAALGLHTPDKSLASAQGAASPSTSKSLSSTFSSFVAQASAAVFSSSPSAAPFKTNTPIGSPSSLLSALPSLPATPTVSSALSPSALSSPLSPASSSSRPIDKFLGESELVSTLYELKSSQTTSWSYVLLTIEPMTPIQIQIHGPTESNKKVFVISSPEQQTQNQHLFDTQLFRPDFAGFMILMVKQPPSPPIDSSSSENSNTLLPHFIVIEWHGSEKDMSSLLDLQDFSPILQSFLRKYLSTISLYMQVSSIAPTKESILADLNEAIRGRDRSAAKKKNRGPHSYPDSDEEQFVDLNAQLAEEKRVAAAAVAATTVTTEADDPDIVTVEDVEAHMAAARALATPNRRPASSASSIPSVSSKSVRPSSSKSPSTSTATPSRPLTAAQKATLGKSSFGSVSARTSLFTSPTSTATHASKKDAGSTPLLPNKKPPVPRTSGAKSVAASPAKNTFSQTMPLPVKSALKHSSSASSSPRSSVSSGVEVAASASPQTTSRKNVKFAADEADE